MKVRHVMHGQGSVLRVVNQPTICARGVGRCRKAIHLEKGSDLWTTVKVWRQFPFTISITNGPHDPLVERWLCWHGLQLISGMHTQPLIDARYSPCWLASRRQSPNWLASRSSLQPCLYLMSWVASTSRASPLTNSAWQLSCV